jgi:hypothetical protein
MTIDNISPAGAWKSEMERMPWKYSQQAKVDQALASIRSAGLQLEANVLALEITTLKSEVELLRNRVNKL